MAFLRPVGSLARPGFAALAHSAAPAAAMAFSAPIRRFHADAPAANTFSSRMTAFNQPPQKAGVLTRAQRAIHTMGETWKATAEPKEKLGELIFQHPQHEELQSDDHTLGYHGTALTSLGDQLQEGAFKPKGTDLYIGDEHQAAHFGRLRNVKDLNNKDEHGDVVVLKVASKGPLRVNEAFSTYYFPGDNHQQEPVKILEARKLHPRYIDYISDPNKRLLMPRIKTVFQAGLQAAKSP